MPESVEQVFPAHREQATTTLDECLDKVKQETRRYAKKQLTWFRKEPFISWMEGDKDSDTNFFIKKCENIIAKKDFL